MNEQIKQKIESLTASLKRLQELGAPVAVEEGNGKYYLTLDAGHFGSFSTNINSSLGMLDWMQERTLVYELWGWTSGRGTGIAYSGEGGNSSGWYNAGKYLLWDFYIKGLEKALHELPRLLPKEQT